MISSRLSTLNRFSDRSYWLRRLLAEGWRVHGVVRPESKVTPLPTVGEGFVLHRYDGTTEAMVAIMAEVQPTVVFHLASLFLSEHQPKDVVALVQSNVLFGTQVVDKSTYPGDSGNSNDAYHQFFLRYHHLDALG